MPELIYLKKSFKNYKAMLKNGFKKECLRLFADQIYDKNTFKKMMRTREREPFRVLIMFKMDAGSLFDEL